MAMVPSEFSRERHVRYFLAMLDVLPSAYERQENNRLTLAYFAISALDILNALHQVVARDIIDWVYGLQVLPLTGADIKSSTLEHGMEGPLYGFRGSPSIGLPFSSDGAFPVQHDGGHMAATYSALAILRILGDDFSRVARRAVVSSMCALQQPDGSFCPVHLGAETDLRFTFCAAAICAMLDDWRGIDLGKALTYILNSQSYDEGFGLSPGLEPHGGGTYCAVATLKLMRHITSDAIGVDKLSASILDWTALIGWCLRRQAESGGFQGRSNKDADACYAFWLGGSLQMLGAYHLCDKVAARSFLLTCQSKYGGFSKYPKELPDLLHAYYSICGLSLLEEPGMNTLCCELGITSRAAQGLPLCTTQTGLQTC